MRQVGFALGGGAIGASAPDMLRTAKCVIYMFTAPGICGADTTMVCAYTHTQGPLG